MANIENRPHIVRQTIVYSDGTMTIYVRDSQGRLVPETRKVR